MLIDGEFLHVIVFVNTVSQQRNTFFLKAWSHCPRTAICVILQDLEKFVFHTKSNACPSTEIKYFYFNKFKLMNA